MNNLAGVNIYNESTIVQMADGEGTTSEGRQQVDLDFSDQIVVLPLESFMRLLLDNDDNVSWCNAWGLVALAAESDRLAALHALIDMHLQHFLLGYRLATVTGLASVLLVDNLPRSRTLVTWLLNLLDHGTHLTECDPNTPSVAGVARSDGAFFPPLSRALTTDDIPCESKFGGLAPI